MSTKPSFVIRAAAEKIEAYDRAAKEAGLSRNKWAVAVLDAEAASTALVDRTGFSSSGPILPGGESASSSVSERSAESRPARSSGEAAADADDPGRSTDNGGESEVRSAPLPLSRRLRGGACPRERMHRKGEYCKECGEISQ